MRRRQTIREEIMQAQRKFECRLEEKHLKEAKMKRLAKASEAIKVNWNSKQSRKILKCKYLASNTQESKALHRNLKQMQQLQKHVKMEIVWIGWEEVEIWEQHGETQKIGKSNQRHSQRPRTTANFTWEGVSYKETSTDKVSGGLETGIYEVGF